ncbi:MAG TPA: diguanylate cyclase [Polyangiaceae bacterium]|nr:diguanylate cyclase [Polyangiaceae bacterium]
MSKVISYVADMTRQRERHVLEASLADVLFKLLKPTSLRIWRVHAQAAEARVQLVTHMEATPSAPEAMNEAAEWPLLDSLPGVRDCYRSGAPLWIDAESGHERRHFLPVTSEKETIGVLEIERRSLTDAQLQIADGMLTIYRNHLALLDYSEHDELTGLLNRKTFESVFSKRAGERRPDEIDPNLHIIGRRTLRQGAKPWLAVVDIDHFKRVNDTFGHVFGDEVLLLLAGIMRSTFRTEDALFRFGGEEFAVLLAATDEPGAETALERFRRTVETHVFPQVGSVTVSVGYCEVLESEDAMSTFERADAALYFAKQHGRNQVQRYEALVMKGKLVPKAKPMRDIELF